MRDLLLKTCILLPAFAVANGAIASDNSHSTAPVKSHAKASKGKSRVLGGHTTVAAEISPRPERQQRPRQRPLDL